MDLLTEGQKLSLYFQKDSNIVEMICSIEKVWDDRLDIVLPQYFMRYIDYLKVGCKLTAKAFSKLGTVDFNTIVISSPLEDCFSVELDYNAVKLTPGQELPVVNAMEVMQLKIGEEFVRFKTFELSTDHVKFYSDNKFELESQIEGNIILPKDYGTINFKAIVSEIDPIYDNEITAIYSTMTENDRQSLLYYMYMYSKNYD